MNSKPSVPEEMILISREFSWRKVWVVNRWLFAAALISYFCEVLFGLTTRQWPYGWRLAILFTEFLCVLLWARSMVRWIGSMDELQRRLTVATMLFSVSASFFFFLLWLRLEGEGFFHATFGPPFSKNNTWGIYSIAHVFVLLSGFYGLGYLLFIRRYK